MKTGILETDLIPTSIYLAIKMKPDTRITINHPMRPSHGFVFYGSGMTDYVFDGGVTLIPKKHDFIYLPKGSGYRVVPRERGYIYAINFDMTADGKFDPFLMSVNEPQKLERLFKEADAAYRNKFPNYIYKCRAVINEIIMLLKNENPSSTLTPTQRIITDKVVRHINEKFTDDNFAVSQLTEIAGVSEVYLRRIFKLRFGMPPLKYIKDKRIERAKELILSSICTIESAGILSGFSDGAYFCREFKRATGMKPTEFRTVNTK